MLVISVRQALSLTCKLLCAPGLLWCAEMESISFTPPWLWETRALVPLRSLSGPTIPLSKFEREMSRWDSMLFTFVPESWELTVTHFQNCRYAIRESTSVVKIFKNFKEKKSFKPDFGAEGIINSGVWWDLSLGRRQFSSMDVFLCLLQGSMEASCSGWGQWMASHFMTGRTQNWSAALRYSPNM